MKIQVRGRVNITDLLLFGFTVDEQHNEDIAVLQHHAFREREACEGFFSVGTTCALRAGAMKQFKKFMTVSVFVGVMCTATQVCSPRSRGVLAVFAAFCMLRGCSPGGEICSK